MILILKKMKKKLFLLRNFFDKAYKIFINEKPKIVIVQGDTKTCLISAMAANATRQYNQKDKNFSHRSWFKKLRLFNARRVK